VTVQSLTSHGVVCYDFHIHGNHTDKNFDEKTILLKTTNI